MAAGKAVGTRLTIRSSRDRFAASCKSANFHLHKAAKRSVLTQALGCSKQMTNITFNKDEKALIVRKIQLYFSEELKQQIGQFDAEFLLDFVGQEIGSYFYNRGLYDAQAALNAKLEDVQDAIYQLEQPTDFKK